MSNKIMKTLTLGGNTYEIYDESARTDIATLQTETSQLQNTVNNQQKDIDSLKQNGTGGVVTGEVRKMLTTHVIGEVLKKTESYNSWVFENVKYDAELDRIIVVWNTSDSHVDTFKVCYLGVFNHYTFEFEEIKVINDSRESNDLYCIYGFVILEDGSYLYAPCYDTGVGATASSSIRLMKSTDKGDNWTEVNPTFNNLPSANYFPFSITLLSSNRLLLTDNTTKTFMYSDDKGLNWNCYTVGSKVFEPHFIDCGNGNIICICRKTSYGTSNGSWNGEKQIEPAVYYVSSDNGGTWEYKGDSTSITEMTASNCCSVVKNGYIDLFVCSRFPHADKFGVMYHYYASIENALADNWGTPKVVLYPDCVTGQDFSYPSCCTDKDGNTHLFYYDGDSDSEGKTTIKYLLASNNAVSIPLNTDEIYVPRLPYSAKKIDSLLAKINTKINQLILQGGGEVEDEDFVFYVTDSLAFDFDITNESKIDSENGTITDNLGTSVKYAPSNVILTIQPATLAEKINNLEELTLEFTYNVTELAPSSIHNIMKRNWAILIRTSSSTIHFNNSTGATSENLTFDSKILIESIGYHTVTMTFGNDGTVKAYADGVVVGTLALTDFVSYEAMITKLWEIYQIDGKNKLMQFRVYNKALTEDEVKQNYNYFKTVNS